MTLKDRLCLMYSENLYNEMLFNLYSKEKGLPAEEWRRVTDLRNLYRKNANQLSRALAQHFKDGRDIVVKTTQETQERFDRDAEQIYRPAIIKTKTA